MNKPDQKFQKRIAVFQLLGTAIVAIGAVLVTHGLTLWIFSAELGIDSIQASDEAKNNLAIFSEISLKTGWIHFITGLFLIVGGAIGMSLAIAKEKVKLKRKVTKFSSILFDEMYDGKDIDLEKHGYDTYSVKKLRLKGESLQYDYSVLKYVEENEMILITEDPENYGGCIENGLPCIKLGQNPSIDEVINQIESLKKNKS